MKLNLGSIFVTQEAYHQENLRYGNFTETGFALSGVSNRFSYRSPALGGTGGFVQYGRQRRHSPY